MMFKGITPREWYITVALVTVCIGLFAVEGYRNQGQQARFYRSKSTASKVLVHPTTTPATQSVVVDPIVSNQESPAQLQPSETSPVSTEPTTETALQASAAFVDGLLDLNLATAKDFEQLPGIGPVKAESIVAHRMTLGGRFTSFSQLDEVTGIGPKTMERLIPLLLPLEPVAQTPAIAQNPSSTSSPVAPSSLSTRVISPTTDLVNINTAGLVELQKLSGIGEKKAEAILLDRQTNGPYLRVDDLLRVPGIGPKTIEKNRHLITLRSP